MRVGVHCSVRNGFVKALQEAAALGCQTLQIFTQSPRGWRTRTYAESEFSEFRKERERLQIYPVVVHSPYLPNLCTSNPALYHRSVRALKEDLLRCEKLGAEYLVIHPGAFSPSADLAEGLDQLVAALDETMESVAGRTRVLIENMAGGGRRVGSRFQELTHIFNRVHDRRRLGVCFDTCHALGAGYDLGHSDGVDQTLAEFDREVGIKEIFVFHANDSKAPLGSHRDLHQHIGKGYIGRERFRQLFRPEAFRNCALILETPKDSARADRDNLARLRECLLP